MAAIRLRRGALTVELEPLGDADGSEGWRARMVADEQGPVGATLVAERAAHADEAVSAAVESWRVARRGAGRDRRFRRILGVPVPGRRALIRR